VESAAGAAQVLGPEDNYREDTAARVFLAKWSGGAICNTPCGVSPHIDSQAICCRSQQRPSLRSGEMVILADVT
jgi:hypothetical protein